MANFPGCSFEVLKAAGKRFGKLFSNLFLFIEQYMLCLNLFFCLHDMVQQVLVYRKVLLFAELRSD